VYYKKYCATITQTGTNDPVVTVLENTIGDIVWTRTNVGVYDGTLAGAFTADKTLVFNNANAVVAVNVFRFNINLIRINTFATGATFFDSLLNETAIEIRVYE